MNMIPVKVVTSEFLKCQNLVKVLTEKKIPIFLKNKKKLSIFIMCACSI